MDTLTKIFRVAFSKYTGFGNPVYFAFGNPVYFAEDTVYFAKYTGFGVVYAWGAEELFTADDFLFGGAGREDLVAVLAGRPAGRARMGWDDGLGGPVWGWGGGPGCGMG